jgi:hypothetical protein
MSHFSHPPMYEQVATADHALEMSPLSSSAKNYVSMNQEQANEDSKHDFMSVGKKAGAAEGIGKGATTCRWRGRGRLLPNGNGWLWEILAM